MEVQYFTHLLNMLLGIHVEACMCIGVCDVIRLTSYPDLDLLTLAV